jgi:hypothetical protein
MGLEHLQQFGKIDLPNVVFWQLGKIICQVKNSLSPTVPYF